ncbi:MAG TPA: hypothetical protein VLK58_20745, partial [Conexibacter sp.]|nr:hypothetical protein [Conexibacter sp.]
MLAATAALGAGTAPALAGTLHVSTTADVSSGAGDVGACASGGGCSLRQALALAAFETSDIVLPAGTYELTQGPLVAQRAPGFSTLTQLRGAGAATTTITQTTPGGGRLLDILSGQSEISGITFTGGSVHGADGDASDPDGAVAAGGAIRIAGYPQFFDVVITGNEVVGGDGAPGGDGGAARGGAIEVVDGTPHFERSTVTGNSARGGDGGDGAAPGDGGDAFGGAVDNVATVKLEESTIAGNSARGGGAGAPAAAAEGDAGDAYGGA